MVAEIFALEDVGDVYFDHGLAAGLQCVEDRHRGMGIGGGVDDDPAGILAGILDPGDKFAFVVALAEVGGQAMMGGPRRGCGADVAWP
jgi:hypothetical protein